MPVIRFSNSVSVPTATSITIPFGGTPVVGDLVLVFLLVDNEIVTHQPGWATEFTATPNPWFMLNSLRAPDAATLSGWYHTWNASDSGSSATFTFVPAPTLGIGDKDLPNANAVAIAVVLDGTNLTAVLETNDYGTTERAITTIRATPMKLPGQLTFHIAATTGTTASWFDTDGTSTLVQAITSTNGPQFSMSLFSVANTPAGYRPSFVINDGPQFSKTMGVSVSDAQPQLYNGPYIEEAPMGMNALMARYRMNRYFTVLNNGGTFSAQRYQSTDQIAAATQVFVNNQPITTTDRTNLLNSGVGGDFRAVS